MTMFNHVFFYIYEQVLVEFILLVTRPCVFLFFFQEFSNLIRNRKSNTYGFCPFPFD